MTLQPAARKRSDAKKKLYNFTYMKFQLLMCRDRHQTRIPLGRRVEVEGGVGRYQEGVGRDVWTRQRVFLIVAMASQIHTHTHKPNGR